MAVAGQPFALDPEAVQLEAHRVQRAGDDSDLGRGLPAAH